MQGPCPGVVACLGPSLVSPATCWEHRGPPVVPVAPGSWAVNLHYIDTGFLGGSGGARAGMDIPLHPGSTAPQHVLTALPHFRAVPPPHPTVSHPRRTLSPGARPCHQPAGAAAAPPLCHGTAGAAGLPDFPCPLSTAVSREVDTDLEPGCGPGAGHTGWGLGRAGMVGHRVGNWARRERGPSVPAPPRLQGHILAPASASPRWLILLGSRWGSGGAGISSAALPVPQIFFLRVMFLVLIPFAFSQLSRPVAYHRHR